MRIAQIYEGIAEDDMRAAVDRETLRQAVGRIIKDRREIGLSNDVAMLYTQRERVARAFDIDRATLDMLWKVTSVRNELHENGLVTMTDDDSDSDNDSDNDQEPSLPAMMAQLRTDVASLHSWCKILHWNCFFTTLSVLAFAFPSFIRLLNWVKD